MKIVICTHKGLAKGLLEATEFIVGKVENLFAIELDEGIEDFKLKIQKFFLNEKDGRVLVLSDIKGGTPFNVISELIILGYKNISLFAGVNLAMILNSLEFSEKDDLKEITLSLKESAISSIVNFEPKQIKAEDFQEDL